MKVISKQVLRDEMEAKFASGQKVYLTGEELPRVTNTVIGNTRGLSQDAKFKALSLAKDISSPISTVSMSGQFRSGFEAPIGADKKSVMQLIADGKFASNSLPELWQNFWDAVRIDLTVKKAQHQTIRQFVYNMYNTPTATRIMKLQELFPYGFKFDENNGEGQAVPLGKKMLGQLDTVEFFIKATGFKYTLLADLFDLTLDMGRMNDGVAEAYALYRDNDAMAPILAYDYSLDANGSSQSGAFNDATMGRQELLYNTIVDAIDDIGERTDPLTGAKIPATNLVLVGNSYDINHLQQIMQGLPSVNEKRLPAIPQIDTLVAYDGGEIIYGDEVISFTGVTAGKVYLVKKNRYMNIYTKRGLTLEADAQPDVLTLSKEERAWYYCEAIYNSIGIANFIQEVTLPAW